MTTPAPRILTPDPGDRFLKIGCLIAAAAVSIVLVASTIPPSAELYGGLCLAALAVSFLAPLIGVGLDSRRHHADLIQHRARVALWLHRAYGLNLNQTDARRLLNEETIAIGYRKKLTQIRLMPGANDSITVVNAETRKLLRRLR